MNYDDLVLSLEYVADHIGEMDLWPYEETLRNAAKLIQELQRDAMRLDWAENHPEPAMHAIVGWWATAGEGCREVKFHFRNVIDAAIDEAIQRKEQK